MVRTSTILQHYKSARPRKRLESNKMENVNHAPSQGENPNQQEWRPNEQNSVLHQHLLTDPNHRIEFLILQLAQQCHQDKLEIRQDLMFICQYLKNLTERQEQLWQQMHFHHDEVMTETRHSFQALSSFFLVPTNGPENTTHTFPLHENEMKQGLASSSTLSGRVLLNPDQEGEIVDHDKNEAQQKVFSSGKQGISNTSDHITGNVKRISGESLSAGHNQVMPEDRKNDPGRQTYRNKSRQLNGEFDGTLGVSNIPQALKELDEQLSSKRGEEHHIKPSYTVSETNEGISRKSFMKSDSKERNVKALSADEGVVHVNEHTVAPRYLNEHKVQERNIDDQNVRSRQSDDQRVQGRYVDDQNVRSRQSDDRRVQGRYVDEQNVRSMKSDEQRVQGRYTDHKNVHSKQLDEQTARGRYVDHQVVNTRQIDEQKVQGRYRNEQNVQGPYVDKRNAHTGQIDEHKVQGRYLDEQNVRTRQKDEQKVQGRYRNEQNVHTRHINEQNEQGKYEDEQNVHTWQVDKQNVHTRHINENQVQGGQVGEQSGHTSQIDKQIDKPTNENGQNSTSQLLDQPENVVNTNDSKEQIILADHKPSGKNYADAVVAGPAASSVLEFNASSGGFETLSMPKPFMDPTKVLEAQESFEGTGFYANIISNQLSNSSQSVNSVKSAVSSNEKTYSKAITTKQNKSKTSDSKVFTSGSKGSKQNQGRYQGKYY